MSWVEFGDSGVFGEQIDGSDTIPAGSFLEDVAAENPGSVISGIILSVDPDDVYFNDDGTPVDPLTEDVDVTFLPIIDGEIQGNLASVEMAIDVANNFGVMQETLDAAEVANVSHSSQVAIQTTSAAESSSSSSIATVAAVSEAMSALDAVTAWIANAVAAAEALTATVDIDSWLGGAVFVAGNTNIVSTEGRTYSVRCSARNYSVNCAERPYKVRAIPRSSYQ